MTKTLPPAARVETIRQGIQQLREARRNLRAAGAHRAADYVARALKSAEGAERHALRGGSDE